MANELDEMNPIVNESGRDISVIEKQLQVKVGKGSLVFEIMLWCLGILPGIIFSIMKVRAQNYFRKLQQKIQHDASQIDNYLEQRVIVLKNCARLLDKAIELDKDTFIKIASYRNGEQKNDEVRNEIASEVENINSKINVVFENYPELKSHNEIEDALQQNSYLQKEITAARELYNDTIAAWNMAIFVWPTKMIVAAKNHYTTRIPFTASKEVKEQSKELFF